MGEVVELFPEDRPDDNELEELIKYYGQMTDWGNASPMEQVRCFLDLADELMLIKQYEVALISLSASRKALIESKSNGFKDEIDLIIKSRVRAVCENCYGTDQEAWPIDERNYLTSTRPEAEQTE